MQWRIHGKLKGRGNKVPDDGVCDPADGVFALPRQRSPFAPKSFFGACLIPRYLAWGYPGRGGRGAHALYDVYADFGELFDWP